MTTIKATCPTCGEVSLTPDDIELRVGDDRVDGFYGFCCPDCAAEVRKPADRRIVSMLVTGGVPALPISLYREPVRLCDRFDHPALTPDDLLDFHQLLQTEGWFDRVLVDIP